MDPVRRPRGRGRRTGCGTFAPDSLLTVRTAGCWHLCRRVV